MRPSILTSKQQRLLHYVGTLDDMRDVPVTSLPHTGRSSVLILAERGYLRVKVTITHRGRKHLRDEAREAVARQDAQA